MKKIRLLPLFIFLVLVNVAVAQMQYLPYLNDENKISGLELKPIADYEIQTIPSINTKHQEFCPVVYQNKLLFVSDRGVDLVNNNDVSLSKDGFLNVYYSSIKDLSDDHVILSEKVKSFSSKINTIYHDGPVCFNKEQSEIYFTRVNYVVYKKSKDYVNKPRIFIAKKSDSKWGDPVEFKYNSKEDAYSVSHPSVSSDGQFLFFASDMPGGFGGMDLYVCKKNGSDWETPQNLGSEVNTGLNELFPFIRNDGVLFFSSNGHQGHGGLDIFSCSKNGDHYSNIRNSGEELNSEQDDFGIFFYQDNNAGFFSSNRIGGKGSDDIYGFLSLKKMELLTGKILLSKNADDPLRNSTVLLVDEDGKKIGSTVTDSSGCFEFKNLGSIEKYALKLDEDNPQLKNKNEYYLMNQAGQIVKVTVMNNKGGKFVFENLPTDLNGLPPLTATDEITLAGNLFYGENASKPLANTRINLVDTVNGVIQSVTTNEFGAFVFVNLPTDHKYFIKVDESDAKLVANSKIVLTSKSGVELKTTVANSYGDFKFAFLPRDNAVMKSMNVEDRELRFDLKGKIISENKTEIANTFISAVDEYGTILQTIMTDAAGNFVFVNLPADRNVVFKLDESDQSLKAYSKLFLTNSKGAVLKEFSRKNEKFEFSILSTDQNKIVAVYINDPWLKVASLKNKNATEEIVVIDNIYYDYGKYTILKSAEKTLDKLIYLMQKDEKIIVKVCSHTDSRSSKSFNMKLSQRRSKAVVDYLKAHGISERRLSWKGYGENNILNKCKDGVECMEDEHAKNRRTEFKINRSNTTIPVAH